MMSRPPEFLDVDKMKVEVVGKQKEMQKFFNYLTTMNLPSKLLGLSSLDPTQESHLAKPTSKQRQALLTAYAFGYYDILRRISSEELSNHLKIDKSTLVEHLRKAEKYIIQDIISE